mgnify:CR=1 FL=1|tara:strand:+ start:4038 stop:4316 length:279 start_codon:yes stop_codon:yes gene_type:complete
MASELLFDAGSTKDTVVSAIEAGELWGVSLGTTTKYSTEGTWILVQATETRCDNLLLAIPEEVAYASFLIAAPSVSDADSDGISWYLRAKLE